jgi:hypothetical protein
MAKKQVTYTYGQRVRVKPNKREGWPELFGRYVDTYTNGMCCIVVDRKYRHDHSDDGTREVALSSIDTKDCVNPDELVELENSALESYRAYLQAIHSDDEYLGKLARANMKALEARIVKHGAK